jgi:hypothetical protein
MNRPGIGLQVLPLQPDGTTGMPGSFVMIRFGCQPNSPLVENLSSGQHLLKRSEATLGAH